MRAAAAATPDLPQSGVDALLKASSEATVAGNKAHDTATEAAESNDIVSFISIASSRAADAYTAAEVADAAIARWQAHKAKVEKLTDTAVESVETTAVDTAPVIIAAIIGNTTRSETGLDTGENTDLAEAAR
mmetsp:Transcript_62125/g.134941  ORF Transcript_62125/g.134941 Transcript_62125/m.134941 type:complete len:132 (-) Transcript_62125:17-412(-)